MGAERKHKMNILAIDTSNETLSIAILKNKNLVATITTNQSKNHSVTLMPQIANLLKQVNMSITEIDRFVVAKGPGSYTGLRIGVTTAKTFAYTLSKELVGVSSLAVLAAPINEVNTVIVPIFDARRDNVFAGAYLRENNQLKNVIVDQHIPLEKLLEKLSDYKRLFFVGVDSHKFAERIKIVLKDKEIQFSANELDYPQAYYLGIMGLAQEPVDIHSFVPKYLRLTQAESQWLEKNQESNDESLVEKI